MMENDFYSVPIDEQETIINIDYGAHLINLYTNQKKLMERLIKYYGSDTKLSYINSKIASVEFWWSFSDRKTYKKVLSINTILKGRGKNDM